MKLKPFTFEEWDKDRDQAIYTRKGIPVGAFTFFDGIREREECFAGIINYEKVLTIWFPEGKYYSSSTSVKDLMLLDTEESPSETENKKLSFLLTNHLGENMRCTLTIETKDGSPIAFGDYSVTAADGFTLHINIPHRNIATSEEKDMGGK